MTVEQHMPRVAATEQGSEQAGVYIPGQRATHEVGHTALEGFTIMEAVTSPWHDLRTQLESRVVNQPAAIDAIVDALEGSNVRMPNDKRPIANLAFLGPTGVGKSETAKSLAEFLGKDKKLIKIDCSDFSHGHEVSSLTGSPAGYIGYGQPPIFNKEAVEGHGTVVLFDEIEKASEPLYNLMLQIMEDGELRLKNGQVTSFRDTLIILTSNLGAKEMATQLSSTPIGFGGQHKPVEIDRLDEVAKKSFKEHFRPEFVNRLSKMVVFHPLDRDGLSKVLDTKLAQNNAKYEKQLGIHISLSDATRQYLVDIAAKQQHMGARPLIRAMDEHISAVLGRYQGAGAIGEGTHIKVFHSSEIGDNTAYIESPLIFASKRDASLRKPVGVLAKPPFHFKNKQASETSKSQFHPSRNHTVSEDGPTLPNETDRIAAIACIALLAYAGRTLLRKGGS